jgi:pimeloyl-ACP methyl ester carboxylesterase
MTHQAWSFHHYQASADEGSVEVPGAILSYRLAGAADASEVVVIENGWRASFPYAIWLEEALAPHARVLSYDRAGVGGSRSKAPLTPAALTRQLQALLAHLRIDRPVVIAGHSYGGLVGTLHAAQAPGMVRALAQIDPTPDLAHELLEAPLRSLPLAALSLKLRLRLGLGDPGFDAVIGELPPEIAARLKREDEPGWTIRSLNGSLAEIGLRREMRRAIAAAGHARQCPRLVIGSSMPELATSRLSRLRFREERIRKAYQAIEELLRQQASWNQASRMISLPYNHIGLVTDRDGARQVASSILQFIH